MRPTTFNGESRARIRQVPHPRVWSICRACRPLFILWLLNHTESFPKSERFRLARRLEDTAFEFYDLLMKAARRSRRKQTILLDADLTLEKLYIRLSHDRGLTTPKQYQYASKKLLEIGNLCSGQTHGAVIINY